MKIIDETGRNNLQKFNFKAMTRPPSSREITALTKILSQESHDILNLTNNITNDRFAFLKALAHRYNISEFKKPIEEKANPQLITQAFQIVTNPQSAHFDLIKQFKGSISDLASLFITTEGKVEEVNFLNTVYSNIIKGDKHFRTNLLTELLTSPNKTNFINKFKEYRSYLKLNKDNPNAIKNLDMMLKDGTYNYKQFDKMMDKQFLMKNYPLKYESEIFNKNVYANNYTNERDMVLSHLYKHCNLPIKDSVPELDKEILKTFMTTNKKNYKIRTELIRHYSYLTKTKDIEDKAIFHKNLNQLYEIIEKNKEAKSFVKKTMKANIPINDIDIFSQLFEQIPPRKLNIFNKNALRLIGILQNKKDIVPTVKRKLENPMFTSMKPKQQKGTYNYFDKLDVISTLINKVKNKFHLLRYKFLNHIYGPPQTINSQMAL